MIAFLGTGLLGSGFVRAALQRGEKITVWNRTGSKTEPLAKAGALVSPQIAGAVQGALRVHLVLSDDAAVDHVIQAVLPVLPKSVPIIDHTSTSVRGAAERTRSLAAVGVTYQHCPVFMSPQNALESAGVMLISGEKARYEKLKPVLAAMTGKLVYLGEDPGRAAAMKLAGNLMLMAITTGLADAAAFLKALDIPRTELNNLFENFNPGASVQPRAKRMVSGDFENPSWELQMARKDARLILAEAAGASPGLAMVPHYAAFMDQFIAQGLSHSDWTIIGKNAL